MKHLEGCSQLSSHFKECFTTNQLIVNTGSVLIKIFGGGGGGGGGMNIKLIGHVFYILETFDSTVT